MTLLLANSMVDGATATGTIDGGWSYIIAAYAVTWAVVVGYGLSLLVRSGDGGAS